MNSDWLLGFLIILLSIGVAVIGVLVVRRSVPLERLRNHNEVAGPIHATIGVIYAVILAFVVIVVWEQMNAAYESVVFEAGELIALNHDLVGLPRENAEAAHNALMAYTESVLDQEWKALEADSYIVRSNPEYDRLWYEFRQVRTIEPVGQIWLESIISRLNEIDRWRSERILAVEDSVPAPLWILLICGGIVTVLFAALFGAEHRTLQMVMVGALAALIAFSLFLITAIDHPFSGIVRIEPEAFHHALEQIERNPPSDVRRDQMSRPEEGTQKDFSEREVE